MSYPILFSIKTPALKAPASSPLPAHSQSKQASEAQFAAPTFSASKPDVFFRAETADEKRRREEAAAWTDHEKDRSTKEAAEQEKLQRTRRSGRRKKP
ncbi:MAG: hypothetical protein VKJ04_12075 [Vampirovibrionales bacterium]|nr:hypothetical protein [Vampirovibrionales bacterium]